MTTESIDLKDLNSLYMLLFNLILRHDDRLRLDVAEAIRKILQNPVPTHQLSPAVRDTLRQMRVDLLAEPDKELGLKLSRPPIRLVDDE